MADFNPYKKTGRPKIIRPHVGERCYFKGIPLICHKIEAGASKGKRGNFIARIIDPAHIPLFSENTGYVRLAFRQLDRYN